MKAVDLLSADPKPASGRRVQAGAAGAALLLAVLLTAAAYAHVRGTVTGNDDRVAGLRRELALAEQARRQPPAAGESPAASGLREAVLATLGGRQSWGGILRGVGRVMPQGVWLTKLSLSSPGAEVEAGAGAPAVDVPAQSAPVTTAAPPAGPAPGQVTLSLTGCALNQRLVGRAVSGLNRLPGTSEASVSSKQGNEAQGSTCRGYPSFQSSFGLAEGAS